MTKSTMITTIQEKELELWENLKVVERVFGKDSIQAKYKRAVWNSVWGSNERHGYKDIRQGCPMSKERSLIMRDKIVIYRSGVERLIDDVNKKDLNEYNHGRLDLLKAMLLQFEREGTNMKTEITLYRSVIENLMDEMSTKETSEYANGRLDLLKALLLLFDEEGQ